MGSIHTQDIFGKSVVLGLFEYWFAHTLVSYPSVSRALCVINYKPGPFSRHQPSNLLHRIAST